MNTIKIDTHNFEQDVLKSKQPVVVDFWAEWCDPCKKIAPSLDEIASELKSEVIIAKINIDESPELATQFGIRSIPTLLMFKNGEVTSKMVSAAPKSRLLDWIKSALKA